MGWRSDQGGGTGAEPGPGKGLPGNHEAADSAGAPGAVPVDAPGRVCDLLLPGFAKGGEWDACRPSAASAAALEAASGAEWRCPDASRDEMLGLLRQWQALESWAAAGKLGVLRALIRDDDQPLPGGGYRGDLPEGWTKSLTHEVALALSMSAVSAENVMWLAWNLQALLPGTGALLADGELTLAKARAVDAALSLLSGEDAAKAEAMILPELPGKTYGQVKKLAVQAAVSVDPESATRRREDAERNRCRVEMFREESGAAALSGRELPTDQTLAAHASVCTRAQEYKDSRAFPDDTRMDQFRTTAYLDLLNSITVEARIASGQIVTVTRTCEDAGADAGTEDDSAAAPGTRYGAAGTRSGANCGQDRDAVEPDAARCGTGQPDADAPSAAGRDCGCRECDGNCQPATDGDDDPGGDDPGGDDSGDDDSGSDEPSDDDSGGDEPGYGNPGGPDDGGSSGGGPRNSVPPGGAAPPSSPPRLADLVLPLATLLGLAERPGEGHGLGPLDPNLSRELAAAALASPWTRFCITVTDPDGIAVGHGCARLARPIPRNRLRYPGNTTAPTAGSTADPRSPAVLSLSLPARVNLTISAARLPGLAARSESSGPPGQSFWTFIQSDDPGPPSGFGSWRLTLPSGRNLTVNLEPVPTFECDHRHESHAYQPNDTLRHLVQVRDGNCTFPPCSRHARESDFEHAIPYHKGGRSCACNAGARSRACHQVKQSPGWNVSQPRPGWHQWQTPSGRTYTQGPKRYPA